MYDPNSDLQLWESGAIMQYLVEQYDTEKLLSYTALKDKHLLNQWLMFQMSQQGPMYGQVGWYVFRIEIQYGYRALIVIFAIALTQTSPHL